MNDISIIIPTYNQCETLVETIDSAIQQTISCEIIVVNDGSTDKTTEYLESYKDKNIKIINQVNKGLSSARNTGIMNATGRWILPLDSDDILLAYCAEKILSTEKKLENTNENVDIIGLSFHTFGLSNEFVRLMQNPTLEDFKGGNRLGYCSAIKKSALLECGGYSPKMVYGYEDLHLWHDLLSRGKKVYTIQEPMWMYRVKKQSMITESLKHHDELMTQIKKDFDE